MTAAAVPGGLRLDDRRKKTTKSRVMPKANSVHSSMTCPMHSHFLWVLHFIFSFPSEC
jgi:hypothetical protein